MEKIKETVELAKQIARIFEGLYLKPYLCPAGVPTIGYGATSYPDGRRVSLNDPPITKEYAEYLLHWEMERCARGVIKYCPVLVKYPNRWGAITDFCFNLGVGRLQYSTLRKRLNEQHWEEAKYELMKWVNAGGRKLQGLVKRRLIEAQYL